MHEEGDSQLSGPIIADAIEGIDGVHISFDNAGMPDVDPSMAQAAPQPAAIDAGPNVSSDPSRVVRMLTSWKLWILMLILGLLGIGISLSLPFVYRARAVRYFAQHPYAEISVSNNEPQWIDRYSDWAVSFRVEVDELRVPNIDSVALRHIAALDDARVLVLGTNPARPISERELATLPPFERLTNLHLIGPGFTDEGVSRMLSANPPLQEAMLIESGTGPLTMAALAQCPSIHELTLFSRTLTDEGFPDIAPMPNLETFYCTGVGDQGADWLAKCPNIREAGLYVSPISTAGLMRMCDCPHLTDLELHGAQITDADVLELLNRKSLSSLQIAECPYLTADGITDWPMLPNLQVLGVSADLLTAESVARLREMPDLRALIVWGTISEPDLRLEIHSHWALQEEPQWSGENLWRVIREQSMEMEFGL